MGGEKFLNHRFSHSSDLSGKKAGGGGGRISKIFSNSVSDEKIHVMFDDCCL